MLSQSLLIKCHAKQSLARGLLVRNYLVSYSLESYVYPRGDLSSFIAAFHQMPGLLLIFKLTRFPVTNQVKLAAGKVLLI